MKHGDDMTLRTFGAFIAVIAIVSTFWLAFCLGRL